MTDILNKIAQVSMDVLMGLSAYWFFTNVLAIEGNLMIIFVIAITAVIAEFTEIRLKK